MGEGPEITGSIILPEPCQYKPRPRICRVDLGEEKALIIPEAHIIPGPILLDELSFEKKRLLLITHEMHFKVPDGIKKGPGLEIGLLPAGRHEIAPQSLP